MDGVRCSANSWTVTAVRWNPLSTVICYNVELVLLRIIGSDQDRWLVWGLVGSTVLFGSASVGITR